MNSKEFEYIDKLFEAARKVPARVELDQVKETLKEGRTKGKNLGTSFGALRFSDWQMSIAAGLTLVLSLTAWMISLESSGDSITPATQVALENRDSNPFALLDTYKGEPLSYWDTSSTHHGFSSISFKNIHCIQTYLADTACHISIALELGKPDLVNFFLADVSGKIIKNLLVEERQHQADSSYNFDLCQLKAGPYQLVVNTTEGDYIRKPIFLN